MIIESPVEHLDMCLIRQGGKYCAAQLQKLMGVGKHKVRYCATVSFIRPMANVVKTYGGDSQGKFMVHWVLSDGKLDRITADFFSNNDIYIHKKRCQVRFVYYAHLRYLCPTCCCMVACG